LTPPPLTLSPPPTGAVGLQFDWLMTHVQSCCRHGCNEHVPALLTKLVRLAAESILGAAHVQRTRPVLSSGIWPELCDQGIVYVSSWSHIPAFSYSVAVTSAVGRATKFRTKPAKPRFPVATCAVCTWYSGCACSHRQTIRRDRCLRVSVGQKRYCSCESYDSRENSVYQNKT
jgi:hypothetical protein